MDKIKCEKCGTETLSKFCPDCGHKLIKLVRNYEQIARTKQAIKATVDLMTKTNNTSLSSAASLLLVDLVLNWVTGGSPNPLEIAAPKELRDNEEFKSLLNSLNN